MRNLTSCPTAAGKEYAKADSRYATRDSCVVGIEALAMFMGPLSFLCAYGIAARRPWRHTLQLLVSMGQLYGDVLYFMSAQFEGAPCHLCMRWLLGPTLLIGVFQAIRLHAWCSLQA